MSPLPWVILFVGLFCGISAGPIIESPKDDDVINLPNFGPRSYVGPSNKTGDLVGQWNHASKMNPEELGEYLEGDMILPPSITKSGMKLTTYRWANRIVPYVINGTFNAAERSLIISAFNVYHAKTCIKFLPRSTQNDYIIITNAGTGCWSYIGRVGGGQTVNLQSPGCVTLIGTVLHEFMHALGFIHEHSRPERDNYVSIKLQNVATGLESNFNKYATSKVDSFGSSYDYGSVMHYTSHAFSKNGLPTIVPKQNGVTIGQRKQLSASDIKSINNMYCPR